MVLVIHRQASMTQDVVDMFRYMDILAYGTQPKEAITQICSWYRAVLILYPECIPDLDHFLSQLTSVGGDIPLFAISDTLCADTDPRFVHVFPCGVMSSTVATEMARLSRERSLLPIGDYRLAGIDASYQLYTCHVHGHSVNLTATEARILRLLIRSFPTPIRACDMLPYIFAAAKLPDAATVRTHICAINRKLRAACGMERMIEFSARRGYRLLQYDTKSTLLPV